MSLPHYDVSDGLISSNIHAVFQDRRGFLWFGTNDGLSRFDGYRFVNYSRREGLPNTDINCVVEDREGRIWVATNGGGIARLLDRPDEASESLAKNSSVDANVKFVHFAVGSSPSSNRVNKLLFDSRGHVWCLTDGGVFRAQTVDDPSFALFIADESESQAIAEDATGHLWLGLGSQLIEVGDRRIVRHGPERTRDASKVQPRYIVGISQAPNLNLLVARVDGLYEFIPTHGSSADESWRALPLHLNVSQSVQAMFLDQNGAVWLGTPAGLIKYQNGAQTTYSAEQGLSVDYIRSICADRSGNIWIGSGGGGAYKLPGETIVSYTQDMGLPHAIVSGVLEDSSGHIFAAYTYSPAELVELTTYGIKRHAEMTALPLRGRSALFKFAKSINVWGVQTPFTGGFLMKHPKFELHNGRFLRATDLIHPGSQTSILIYEDDSGGLWFDSDNKTIHRTDSTNPNLQGAKSFDADFNLTEVGGYPLMITDHAGGLWLGGVERLGRLWHGNFQTVSSIEGLPRINPLSFYMDSRGWLWMGMRNGGIAATREPGAEHPKFESYLSAQTLSSDSVYSIVEDEYGRMYFGTTRGLDRFDPKSSEWRHFTTKDGLAGNRVLQLLRDQANNIWVATSAGVSKFDPGEQPSENSEAPIYISRVNVAGDDLRLPELGANQISKIELPAERNNMTFEFFGLQFKGEDYLRYQYRLDGTDAGWSRPTKNRSVTFARLAPGDYRFSVRAMTEGGVVSSVPAEFQFRILQPVWRRAWFLLIAIAGFLIAIYAAYRYRVGRLIELERVRMRIATDLHDDIGANLSLIAMVSDIEGGSVRPTDTRIAGRFALIANTSRATMDSMSDIVWAVNPKKDQISDLTQRMRRVADDIFTTSNIEYELRIPGTEHDRAIAADKRREVFMIFKEAVNNIARHSRCTRANIEFAISGEYLEMKLSDNGQGFDLAANSDGNGMASMKRRADSMSGTIEIVSQKGVGTTIFLKAPISSGPYFHVAG